MGFLQFVTKLRVLHFSACFYYCVHLQINRNGHGEIAFFLAEHARKEDEKSKLHYVGSAFNKHVAHYYQEYNIIIEGRGSILPQYTAV